MYSPDMNDGLSRFLQRSPRVHPVGILRLRRRRADDATVRLLKSGAFLRKPFASDALMLRVRIATESDADAFCVACCTWPLYARLVPEDVPNDMAAKVGHAVPQ